MGDLLRFPSRIHLVQGEMPGVDTGDTIEQLAPVLQFAPIETPQDSTEPQEELPAILTCFEIMRAIKKALAGSFINARTYREMQELVRTYDTEQVAKLLAKSTQSDWLTRPAFYKALANKSLY